MPAIGCDGNGYGAVIIARAGQHTACQARASTPAESASMARPPSPPQAAITTAAG
eukprot:CAMPEP_0202912208 /NCGR_PEP_ID=MMETSP1392-20130828/57110_1 /ASSEMBLY_ACC=CAM_ASM_000868 /TAXON_ID=225041 /ORGANISM="Chlamydomonas chlamydogama, Strain SAG 11-48b" /LENGTH=54 /DNA_ID=CAMNT_0049603031 /DNA_START=473 /DNA_END=633 /DNA_ORIENTATION=+